MELLRIKFYQMSRLSAQELLYRRNPYSKIALLHLYMMRTPSCVTVQVA